MTEQIAPTKYYTAKEIASITQVSIPSSYRLISDIGYYQFGGRKKVLGEDLVAYLKQAKRQGKIST